MRLWDIYHKDVPPFLSTLAQTPEMMRLEAVGMNCGCEYTSFPRFRNLGAYSRYDHSMGVALIIWRFTGDPVQSVAGLFHDIATPVFAHVVDFLRGDHLRQEATEEGTEGILRASPAINALLRPWGITPEQVSDYHRFPIADNDTPRLSADRLEYTLGNLVNFGFSSREEVRSYYEDLTVCPNEDGVPELAFQTESTAFSFAEKAMLCAGIYVSPEDRYAMQMLSELLGRAMKRFVIEEKDLLTTEEAVIRKLTAQEATAREWKRFCSYSSMLTASFPGPEPDWRQIRAKKRYIDPLIKGKGRASASSAGFSQALSSFLSQDFEEWLRGI